MNKSLVLFIGLSTMGCFESIGRLELPFHSAHWKKSDSTTKFRMKDDLFANYKVKIIGNTKDEVISLLGLPDLDSAKGYGPKCYTMMYDISDSTYDQCPCNLDIVYDSTGTIIDMSSRDM